MTKRLWRLNVLSEFSAAHALRAYQGKCENLHGHNYKVEMCVEGARLVEQTEFVMDFSLLKKMLKEELDWLDHKNINDLEPFTRINPTSENIACFLYQRMKARLDACPVALRSITVWETDKQSATYMEMEGEQGGGF